MLELSKINRLVNPLMILKGSTLLELDEIEDVFKIDIDVLEFKYEPPCLVPIRRSAYKQDDLLHLLLVHDCHFSYIRDAEAATKTIGCLRCSKQ